MAGADRPHPEGMDVVPAVVQGLGGVLKADRLASHRHAAIDVEPVLLVVRRQLADPFADDVGQSRLSGEGVVDLEKTVVASHAFGVEGHFDNAEARIDGVEKAAIAGLADRLGVLGGLSPAHLGLDLPGPGGVQRDGLAQLQLRHHLARQQFQRQLLARGDAVRPGRSIQHADGAQRQTLRRLQQRAGIEPQPVVHRHQRVRHEPRILPRVGDHHGVVLQYGVSANRHVERQLTRADADLGLEPLPAAGDQVDDCDRRLEHLGRQARDIVKLRLQGGVEDRVAVQRGEAVELRPSRRLHQTVTLERRCIRAYW